mmetsp:Transcript_146009/g.364067  ORF Transcript_146009/g.364067 Transcript_146009/m.364067 type:complete len:156 (-) Transcript_146009:26-493(-)
MPMLLRHRRAAPAVSSKVRDGFADFYGYAEAGADLPQPGCALALIGSSQDAFAQFYGYSDDSPVLPELGTVFLPDRDPGSPGSAEEEEQCCQRRQMDAVETSLALIRSTIEEKRGLLAHSDQASAERLSNEIQMLKMQQTRLAAAMWSLGEVDFR